MVAFILVTQLQLVRRGLPFSHGRWSLTLGLPLPAPERPVKQGHGLKWLQIRTPMLRAAWWRKNCSLNNAFERLLFWEIHVSTPGTFNRLATNPDLLWSGASGVVRKLDMGEICHKWHLMFVPAKNKGLHYPKFFDKMSITELTENITINLDQVNLIQSTAIHPTQKTSSATAPEVELKLPNKGEPIQAGQSDTPVSAAEIHRRYRNFMVRWSIQHKGFTQSWKSTKRYVKSCEEWSLKQQKLYTDL